MRTQDTRSLVSLIMITAESGYQQPVKSHKWRKRSARYEIPHLNQVTEPVDHGEGPTWDSRAGVLYFVDIHSGRVLCFDPTANVVSAVHLGGDVTPVIPLKSDVNKFIVGVNRSVVVLEWDHTKDTGGRYKVLTTVAQDKPTSRFNDGKADSAGRLWFGTMGYENSSGVVPNEGSLYMITKDNLKDPFKVVTPVNISNGLAWNYANDKFYYIDTPTRQIKEFDYDYESGKISNGRVVFDLAHHQNLKGYPDGMTIDTEDNLWIALYNGGSVIKISPKTGKLLKVLELPATHITSVAWGGSTLDTLYVTTSRFALTQEERIKEPKAGSLFALTNLGSHGVPAFEANIVDDL